MLHPAAPAFFVFVLLCSPALAQQDRVAREAALDLRARYDKAEYMVPMRDGARLCTAVYTPTDRGRSYPVLLWRTPYSVGDYGDDFAAIERMAPSREFVEAGCIFVLQDIRGTYRSEGNFEVIRPIRSDKSDPRATDESTDNYDTMDWVLENIENHNGAFRLMYAFWWMSLAARERDSLRGVAVKVPDRRVLEDARSRERFLRELRTLAALEHPHVVQIFEVSDGAVPFYSMELVTGDNLEALLAVRGALSPTGALRLLTPMAEALAYIHDRGIVHRDFKPANILLDSEGSPRLSDFGIVYLGTRTGITSTGIMIGTMGYMAPEQLAGYPPTPAVDSSRGSPEQAPEAHARITANTADCRGMTFRIPWRPRI